MPSCGQRKEQEEKKGGEWQGGALLAVVVGSKKEKAYWLCCLYVSLTSFSFFLSFFLSLSLVVTPFCLLRSLVSDNACQFSPPLKPLHLHLASHPNTPFHYFFSTLYFHSLSSFPNAISSPLLFLVDDTLYPFLSVPLPAPLSLSSIIASSSSYISTLPPQNSRHSFPFSQLL